jgi:hypothetical protein
MLLLRLIRDAPPVTPTIISFDTQEGNALRTGKLYYLFEGASRAILKVCLIATSPRR